MSYFNNIAFSDTGSLDAFSRLRVSSPEAIFAVQCQYNKATIQMETWSTWTGSTPTHDANNRMVQLGATAGIWTSYIQSFQYCPYQPWKSQFIAITWVLGAWVQNTTADVWYFDNLNWVIFRQNGTTNLQFILRTSTGGSVSDANIVQQSAWNIDKMDWTWISWVTLDITKSFILIIDLQFLWMGRVRIGFDIDWVLHYCHEFINANNLSVPYMQSATLPVQMLVTALSSATTKTSYFKCATVQSEWWNLNLLWYQISTPEATVTAGNGTRAHLLSVRPKTTFNGIINRELFILNIVNLIVTGSNNVFWELCIWATFSVAPTYADVNTSYSWFEYWTGGTYSWVGGIVIASGYLVSWAQQKSTSERSVSMHYPISLDRSWAVRANGTLSLLVTWISWSSSTRGTIEFYEIR